MFAVITRAGNYYTGTALQTGSPEAARIERMMSKFSSDLGEARKFNSYTAAYAVAESINEEYRDWGIDANASVFQII